MYSLPLRLSLVVAFWIGLCIRETVANDWQPQKAPLMTRWAKDVSPDKVHPEYPRPQMVREKWINLNGLWDYAIVDGSARGSRASDSDAKAEAREPRAPHVSTRMAENRNHHFFFATTESIAVRHSVSFDRIAAAVLSGLSNDVSMSEYRRLNQAGSKLGLGEFV